MKKYLKRRKFVKPCPKGGGYCLNPLCMFGCIENQKP